MNRLARLSFGLALTLAAPSAFALQQPDGTVIPVPKANKTEDLQTIFDMQGDTIQVQPDAADVPETFDPKCNLTFTLISRGSAAFQNVFGWYNVTGSAPPISDLHVLIPCNAQPVSSFPLDIKNDPAYKGGKIGFFLITPENQASYCASTSNIGYVYYSEKALNPDNMGANSYIHLLVYDSKVKPSTFYFAWEDLFAGGDNEFADLVARVEGISCSGGGAPCDTGKKGICATGTKQCQNGTLVCVDQTTPKPSKCNGLDNDCDGTVDTGPCAMGEVCFQGSCVPNCGKDNCPAGTTCDVPSGLCVDTSCVGMTCGAGTKCSQGKCLAPCDGVVCPHGTTCVVGACIDPCVGLTCDADQVCDGGACVTTCACAACPGGKTCSANGTCVEPSCAAMTCPAGSYCSAGACVDSCAGAMCPGGGACSKGVCGPPMGTGGAGGAGGSGGSGAGGSAGSGGNAGTSGAGGAAGKAGGGGASGTGGTAGAGGTSGVGGAAGKGGVAGAGASGTAGTGGGSAGTGTAGVGGAGPSGGKGGVAGKAGSATSAGGSGGKSDFIGAGGAAGGANADPAVGGGCGCAVPGERPGNAVSLVVLALVAALRKRTPRRDRRRDRRSPHPAPDSRRAR
jgi:hypothetical protein